MKSDRFYVSHFTFHLSALPFTRLPLRLLIILIGLLFPALACGLSKPQYRFNNEVRLTIFEYEREVRGRVDDLVIHFRRDEPRLKFEGQNQNGGRTVWLYRLGAEEFFTRRPPHRSYLYIQEIEYNDDRSLASVKIFRGDGTGYQGRQLTLVREKNNVWTVVDDTEIPGCND